MKVILTAFDGKLESRVLEYPEGIGPEFWLPLDIDEMGSYGVRNENQPFPTTRQIVGRFITTGFFRVLIPGKADTAQMYKLVQVIDR